ncbi:MAG TPA: hypothetical protein VH518_10835 [Tepidisphaeraceae bacterium]|jgi:hypothetical protein
MTTENPIPNVPLDQATADRLARLRAMPVDTSNIDAQIAAKIPRPREAPVLLRIRALRAVAASLALIGLIGAIIWSLSGGAVLAEPTMMAQFHEELVSGKVAATQVKSIAEANQALKDQWEHGVSIPSVPTEHVMMCCMRSIQDKRLACVLLQSDRGVPVTMAVAKAMDMRIPPNSERVVKNGLEFHIQRTTGLTMVMTERGGRWICLIGALPSDRLIDIGAGIEF